MPDELTNLTVEEITTSWRPGSHHWLWPEEYDDLANDPTTKAIEERIDKEGIGFADALAPILLGSDGRVWDGHHRIIIAMKRGIKTLNVDIVEPRWGSPIINQAMVSAAETAIDNLEWNKDHGGHDPSSQELVIATLEAAMPYLQEQIAKKVRAAKAQAWAEGLTSVPDSISGITVEEDGSIYIDGYKQDGFRNPYVEEL